MKRSFVEDYGTGLASEDALLSQLRILDPSLKKTRCATHPFDFVNPTSTCFVELKTRSNAKDKYPTTMVSQSKIKWANEYYPADFYFAFKFTDGLFYIKYDSGLFATFEVAQAGRFDRGRPELNQYCFIPVNHLVPLLPPEAD